MWSLSSTKVVVISSSSWIVKPLKRSTHVKNAPQSSVQSSLILWSSVCEVDPVPRQTRMGTVPLSCLLLAVGPQTRTRINNLASGQTNPSHDLVF